MENYSTNKKQHIQSCINRELLNVLVCRLSVTSIRKPQTTTLLMAQQQQLALTSESPVVVDRSNSTTSTASKKETNGSHIKNRMVHWRRSKYNRNRQNHNNKLLYALVQLHNHYIHLISFLNEMMTLLTVNQQLQPQQLCKTIQQKNHSKR